MKVAYNLFIKNIYSINFPKLNISNCRSLYYLQYRAVHLTSTHLICEKKYFSLQNFTLAKSMNHPVKRDIHFKTLLTSSQLNQKEKRKEGLKFEDVSDKFEDAIENISEKLKDGDKAEVKMDRKSMFKQTIKDYGLTVVIFHVCISLISLGTAYILVSSGLDVVGWLKKLGLEGYMADSKIIAGGSTFIVAYAFHKVFAPARMAITITSAPFIVRFLRNKGILKTPKKK